MDNEGIDGPRAVDRLLADKASPGKLRALVEGFQAGPPDPIPADHGLAVVAGSALDLSGNLDCYHWECRQKQLDKLIQQTWHYFDQVIVVGPSPNALSSFARREDAGFMKAMESEIRFLVHVREIGATDVLLFRPKPSPCLVHWRENAEAAGLGSIIDYAKSLADQVSSEGTFALQAEGDRIRYSFRHQFFEHTQYGTVPHSVLEMVEGPSLEHAIATLALREYVAYLTSDLREAQSLASPLGTNVSLHRDLLARLRDVGPSGNVAFSLQIPVLREVKAEFLLDLRREYEPEFLSFRGALQTAIRSRTQDTGSSSEELAAQIVTEVIQPELSKIERQLKTAQESLQRKHRVNSVVASVATTCGVLGIIPLAIALTGVCVTQAAAAEHKYIEEKRVAELSDMYFLWRAAEKAHSH